MSSGRGAKGSIKDRLISLLYRLRYQDKKIKEAYEKTVKDAKKTDTKTEK